MAAGSTPDVLVIGAGPAGVAAALRAADLGAKTALVTRDEFGGMAANDGPIPVRTLAHAARLLREARQLERYGIAVGALALDYSKLLSRVREVVVEARGQAAFREQIDTSGAVVHERAGAARFVDAHTIETASALRLHADKIVSALVIGLTFSCRGRRSSPRRAGGLRSPRFRCTKSTTLSRVRGIAPATR